MTEDEKIGKQVRAGSEEMQNTLSEILPKDRIDFTTIAPMISAQNVLDKVASWDVGKSEAIFCYISCHGAYDPAYQNDSCAGHYFAMPGAPLRQEVLFDHLVAKGARLTVLMSNACNRVGGRLTYTMSKEEGAYSIFVPLALGNTGYVNVTSSKPGQLTFGNVMPSVFDRMVSREDMPREKFSTATWDSFWPKLAKGTNDKYHEMRGFALENPGTVDLENLKELRGQADQEPISYEIDVHPDAVIEFPAGKKTKTGEQ